MRAWRRVVTVGVIAALACNCRRNEAAESEPEPGPVAVHCESIAPRTVVEERVLRGSIRFAPERIARVGSEVPGRVRRLAVREGDTVVAGQLVAEVETSLIQDRATAARGELTGARATLAAALATEARIAPLVAHGIAAQQELDDARVRVAQARAALAGLTGTASSAGREVSRGTLRAPVAGVVLRVLRAAGEIVDGTSATPVIEIADPSALEFVANATASDLVALRSGQTAALRLGSADAETVAARVDRVAAAVDPTSGIGAVRFVLADPAGGGRLDFPGGLTGEARVAVGSHEHAIAVADTTLREREGDEAQVLVCDGEHARMRAVHLGATVRTIDGESAAVVVRDGLAAGDRVVVDDIAGIEDGAEIHASAP